MLKHTDEHRRDMIKLLRQNATRADLWTVWSDFVEMSALSISNAVDLRQREAREARYMAIVKRYDRDQVDRFCHALACLTMAMEAAEFADVLGATFMELELASKWAGQFFTPFEICRLMARINLGDGIGKLIEENGFLTVNDPAVGGGAMPIAMAETMLQAGHNYQQCMHVTAQDIDPKAAHMAYVQLSLLHVPAMVIVGNTLAGECREVWYTPAHIFGGWNFKLARRDARRMASATPAAEDVAPRAAPDIVIGQQELAGLFD